MIFMEFLELIARIALTYFKNLEAEEWPLKKKIKSLLDEIFPVIGHRRIEQVTIINEFSESDDEYWI